MYHTLNKLSVDVTRKVLVAEAWVPVECKGRVQEALMAAAARANAQMGTVFQPLLTYEPPPTYFNTSKYTESFQGIVDAYGEAGWGRGVRRVTKVIDHAPDVQRACMHTVPASWFQLVGACAVLACYRLM